MIHPGTTLPRRLGVVVRPSWSRRKIVKTVVLSVAVALLAIGASATGYVILLMARLRPTLPTAAQIAAFRPAEGTTVYSSDGVLLARLQTQNRRVIPIADMPRHLLDATIAVEDTRFYRHAGVDVRGIARAFWADLTHREAVEGGSTITQQLARNVGEFGIGKQKNLTRKLREMMTAMRMEQVFDKRQILEMYLNQVYYGSGAWGAEAAAQTYFGKHASQLDLAQCALLAGLPQRPAAYSPYADPATAEARRHTVLQRMLETGAINEEQFHQADVEPMHLAGLKRTQTAYRAPYFVDWVVQGLIATYGADAVYSGWKVTTTLEWQMQQTAERAVRNGLTYGATQGALVAVDPHTGRVRAMVGGTDYAKSKFNIVTQGLRQPGSAFKLFVYSAALDTGAATLDSTFKDQPLKYQIDRNRTWTVHNYGGGYTNQDLTLLDGIEHSVNTVAVQAAMDAGLDQVVSYARRLGITTALYPYPSVALGSMAVRPIELCAAYGVFAAAGDRFAPNGVLQIKDAGGKTVWQDDPWRRRTPVSLNAATIQQMDLALREVVLRGTGAAAASVPMAFGKTGTTNDRRDAWFAGFTPNLTAVVWVGRPHRAANGSVRYEPMPGATGGKAAAPVWARFMSQADRIQRRADRLHGVGPYEIALPPLPEETRARTARSSDTGNPDVHWEGGGASYGHPDELPTTQPPISPPPAMWTPPPGATVVGPTALIRPPTADDREVTVDICADSGQLATEWCPTTVTVRMPASEVPRGRCRMHHAPSGEG